MNKEKDKSGLAGLLCSIFGLVLFLLPYFGLPLSILGFVLSKKLQTSKANTGRILGLIGIILNSILLFITIIVLLVKPEMAGF